MAKNKPVQATSIGTIRNADQVLGTCVDVEIEGATYTLSPWAPIDEMKWIEHVRQQKFSMLCENSDKLSDAKFQKLAANILSAYQVDDVNLLEKFAFAVYRSLIKKHPDITLETVLNWSSEVLGRLYVVCMEISGISGDDKKKELEE